MTVVSRAASVQPGSYALFANAEVPKQANATLSTADATCTEAATSMTGGFVVVDDVSAIHASGSFNMQTDTGDKITGTFSVPVCKVGNLTAPGSSTPAPTCEP